jgi:DNA repair and recombination RAD54-like protein
MNFDYFADDPTALSTGYELIDQVMEDMAGQKLIIFTNYRLTSAGVTKHLTKYGAVAVYGAISAAAQQRNVDRFMNDPTCQVLVAQVQSAGYGLNLQDTCADVMFMEAPLNPIHFEQAVGRVYRNGQKRKVRVRVAVADGTIQVRLHNMLLKNDELVNRVVRSYQDIRKALYGE